MKINCKLDVSQKSTTHQFELDDFNLTREEWDSMSEEEKFQKIHNEVLDMYEQPYWTLDRFEVKE